MDDLLVRPGSLSKQWGPLNGAQIRQPREEADPDMDDIIVKILWGLVMLIVAFTYLVLLLAPFAIATPFVLFWPRTDKTVPYWKSVLRRYSVLLDELPLVWPSSFPF